MFFAIGYEEPMEPEDAAFLDDLALCKLYGWTLDYTRSLDELDRVRIIETLDGQGKAFDLIRRRPVKTGQGNE